MTYELKAHIRPGLVCNTSKKFQDGMKNRKRQREDWDTHGERQGNDYNCHRQRLDGVNIERYN